MSVAAVPFNLGDLVNRKGDPDKIAYIDLREADHPREYSHGEIDRKAKAIARFLTQRGYPKGTRIGILSFNRAEYAIAYFGITRAGFTAVPINSKAPAETVAYVAKDATLPLVFADKPHIGQIPAGVTVVNFDDDGANGFAAALDYGEFETYRPGPEDIAEVLYTSGSTGRPKGVALSHKGQLWMMNRWISNNPDASVQRFIVVQPMFHMAGLGVPKRTIRNHASLVILPRFDARQFLTVLSRYKITQILAVPTLLARLIKEQDLIETLDLSALKTVSLGSAPLTQALLEKIKRHFPQSVFSHGYGSTEAGGGVFGRHSGGLPTPPISVGVEIPEINIKLVGGPDENEGTMYIRSPALFKYYLNLPDVTAKVLRDGWYDTGDVMRRDKDGFYFFVGRADDMFVCAGENIFPGDIEKMLERHSDIAQASVVPLSDEERDKIPVAFVVLRPDAKLSTQDIKTYALANGPVYQHPRRIQFVNELPWAGTNKIDRNRLKQQAIELETAKQWTSQLETAGARHAHT